MDTQGNLFPEDFCDALRDTAKAYGGVDATGAALFPNKARSAAGRWLSDCLNPERPAKLCPDDLLRLIQLGREINVHTAMYYLADATGYERPRVATPKSPKQQLLEKQAALMQEAARLQEDIDRIDDATSVREIRRVADLKTSGASA